MQKAKHSILHQQQPAAGSNVSTLLGKDEPYGCPTAVMQTLNIAWYCSSKPDVHAGAFCHDHLHHRITIDMRQKTTAPAGTPLQAGTMPYPAVNTKTPTAAAAYESIQFCASFCCLPPAAGASSWYPPHLCGQQGEPENRVSAAGTQPHHATA